jgi:hypothetical protein
MAAAAAATARQRLIDRAKTSGADTVDLTEAVADQTAWTWLSLFTETRDNHWKESGFSTPYRPFPKHAYFPYVLEEIHQEPVYFIEKSRDMMISWLVVGYFTHAAMTTLQREVLLQSQKEEKAWELVEYAKTLYSRSHPAIRDRFPLSKPLKLQPKSELRFANGSVIRGIPEGADQIRSFHPWGLMMDEAAFQPKAGESYDHAVSVCKKIVVVSSVAPGWFSDFVTDNK